MSTDPGPNRILIAGGGIGGLATAIALGRHGIESLVCERAPELREVGAGLLLSPNAVHALKYLGVNQAVRACSREIKEWRILDQRGKLLHRMCPTEIAGTSALSLHRSELQQLLLSQLNPSAVRLGFQVARYREVAGGVEMTDQEGACVQGTALVGADGLRSRVREQLYADGAARFCGYAGWRCVVPWIPEGYEGNWLSETWGEGKRFGISPLGGNRCYWYATVNRPGVSEGENGASREELLEMFKHWHHPIPELIAATPNGTIFRNDIFDRPRRASCGRGRVTLLGDAAHAMTPNLGQGACTALEDAWVLARELAAVDSPIEGLRRYERHRRFRIGCIHHASYVLGQVIQLENPIATAARDLFLRATPEFMSELSMRPLFRFRS